MPLISKANSTLKAWHPMRVDQTPWKQSASAYVAGCCFILGTVNRHCAPKRICNDKAVTVPYNACFYMLIGGIFRYHPSLIGYKMAFDKLTFEAAFAEALMLLASSEKVTKEHLKILSRTVLEAWHATGQVVYANKLLMVLGPVNKKVAVVFFKRFSGYSFDEVQGMFTGKSKKRYEQAALDCVEFLADPHNNIWTWADRHVEIQTKAFELDAVTKYITSTMKKAQGAGLSQSDVLRAVFKAGVEPAALVEAFNQMAFKDASGDEVEIPAEMFEPVKAPAGDAPL